MDIPSSPLRTSITEQYRSGNFEDIARIDGFTVLERRTIADDRASGYDCFSYTFGRDAKGVRIEDDILHVDRPAQQYMEGRAEEGSIVVYGDLKHVGRYMGNGRVRSKWDFGDVFEHPLELVPDDYGDSVRFFIRA